jgi:hypothetical protein
MSVVTEVTNAIEGCVAGLSVSGKMGKSILQPAIAAALRTAGFTADEEDTRQLLRSGMPVWRSKDNGTVVPTKGRRRVDIVVYKSSQLVAMIETESDLGDLRLSGVTKRNGHYDVASIAKSADGTHFDSYNSLERMASAAFCWGVFRSTGQYPSPEQATELLETIRSDDPLQHNPAQVPLFLVSGSCRTLDRSVLSRRLASLSATLVCVSDA